MIPMIEGMMIGGMRRTTIVDMIEVMIIMIVMIITTEAIVMEEEAGSTTGGMIQEMKDGDVRRYIHKSLYNIYILNSKI